MKITLLAFGIVKEIFKCDSVEITLSKGTTVADLKIILNNQYPDLKQLAVYMIALNNEYASENEIISAEDEVAVIPPVSGG